MDMQDLHSLLAVNERRLVVGTRSLAGLPHISAELAVHWDADNLYFLKGPNSLTEQNLREVPEMAVSVIDWTRRKGFQVKGIASIGAVDKLRDPTARKEWTQMLARGCNTLITLKIHEIYDIAPQSLIPKPLWERGENWMQTKPCTQFRAPSLDDMPLAASVLAEIQALNTSNLKTGIPSFVATVDDRGIPNVSPRFILNCADTHWLYGDAFRNKTYRNAGRPSPLAVGMFDWPKLTGYVARGWVKQHFTGELLLQVRQKWAALGFKNEALQAVTFHLADLYRVQVGPRIPLAQPYKRQEWFGV